MASVIEDHPAVALADENTTSTKSRSNSEPRTHEAFDSPEADIILVSRDFVSFRTHSFTLKTTSGWFRSLFSLPLPSSSGMVAEGSKQQRMLGPSAAEPETIHLDEDSATLELLLRMISGLPIQPLMSFDTIDTLLFAADKYEMPGPVSLMRIAVLTPALAEHPLRLYAAASRCGWTEEAKIASGQTLALNLWSDENWQMLARLDVSFALALLKLHRSRRDVLRKKLDEHPFVDSGPSTQCSRCKRPADHHAWRELKNRIVMEMDSRPLGDTVLNPGLIEWPEAKACWESKCPHGECLTVQYDKDETMRLIKDCINDLPKTT